MGTFATAEDVMGEDVKELAKVHEPEEYLIDDSMIIKPLPLEEAKEVEIVKGPNIKFLPIPEKPQQNFCVPVSLKWWRQYFYRRYHTSECRILKYEI